jgi:hypothetical protein
VEVAQYRLCLAQFEPQGGARASGMHRPVALGEQFVPMARLTVLAVYFQAGGGATVRFGAPGTKDPASSGTLKICATMGLSASALALYASSNC